MAFNYRTNRPESLSQAPITTTATTRTTTVATATDSEPPIEDEEIKELRESVRRLQLNLESNAIECSILASELYTAQEESAALKTRCDDPKRHTEQSGTAQVHTCSICCSQCNDESQVRMVVAKCGYVLYSRCCETLNVNHRPGKEKLQCNSAETGHCQGIRASTSRKAMSQLFVIHKASTTL